MSNLKEFKVKLVYHCVIDDIVDAENEEDARKIAMSENQELIILNAELVDYHIKEIRRESLNPHP